MYFANAKIRYFYFRQKRRKKRRISTAFGLCQVLFWVFLYDKITTEEGTVWGVRGQLFMSNRLYTLREPELNHAADGSSRTKIKVMA